MDSALSLHISEVSAWRVPIAMTVPYFTSNNQGGRKNLDVLLFRLTREDGKAAWGEACPSLAGYSPETPDTGWAFAKELLPTLVGLYDAEKRRRLADAIESYPFVMSAINGCYEELMGSDLLTPLAEPLKFRLVATVNTLKTEEAPPLALKYVEEGFTTLKVKVGIDPEEDAKRVIAIYEAVGAYAKQRVDGNRRYSFEDGLKFASLIPLDAIEYFEQPYAQSAWDQMEALSKQTTLPLMLDESIYGVNAIERVARMGCAQAVKLKVSKMGGPLELARCIKAAKGLGLDVVVGNGAASDIGCAQEIFCAVRAGITTAGEMNGFLKLDRRLLTESLEMSGPFVTADADFKFEPNMDVIMDSSIDEITIGNSEVAPT